MHLDKIKNNEHFAMNVIHQSKNSKSWYAIYVNSRHEKCVYNKLKRKNIESSLPLTSVIRQWSDRKKKVEIPLFRGYVFVNINIQNEKLDVLQTEGVVKFVSFGGKIVDIPDKQMHWIHRLLASSNIEYEQEFTVGVQVDVIFGPFKGLRGLVKQERTETRLVVWFDTIMQGVSIAIAPSCLKETKKKIDLPLKTSY